MTEFSDRPFVAGSLIGLRAFGVDKLGRLVGPSFPQVFRPGENEAECRKSNAPYGAMTAYLSAYRSAFTMPMLGTYRTTSPPITKTYGSGACPCGCGMEVEFKDEPTPKRLSEAAVEKPQPQPSHSLAGVNCSCGFYAYFDGGNDWKEPQRVTAVIEGYGVCTVGTRGFRASKAKVLALVEPSRGVSSVVAAHLHRNYPEVPFYNRKREALADFPLSTHHVPSPEDENFWTRSAS